MNKLIIACIIIVLMAFISYTGNITGKSTVLDQIKGTKPYAETQVILDPLEQEAGKLISVTIIPGSEGAKKLITIHSKNGAKKDSTSEWCNLGWTREQQLQGAESYKCIQTNTFDYRIPMAFTPGDYYFRVRDYAKDKTNKCYGLYGTQKENCLSTIAWFTVIA